MDPMEKTIADIEQMIEDYRDNVLQEKYANSFQKLQEKSEELKKRFQELLEMQKTNNMGNLSWKIFRKFQKTMSSFKKLVFFANRYIRKGGNKVQAEHIALQNKYIHNYVMFEEIKKQIDFYIENGKEVEKEFREKTPYEDIQKSFSKFYINEEQVLIPKQNVAIFEKLVKMRLDMQKVLENTVKQLKEYQEKNIEPETEDLGIIFPSIEDSKSFLLSDKEIDKKIDVYRNQIQDLQGKKGKQKTYQFKMANESYQYVIPIAYKGEFINIISNMSFYVSLKNLRENAKKNEVKKEVSLDSSLLKTMNSYQIKTYLETLLIRMESDKRKPSIEVLNHNGQRKEIPLAYYNEYQKVLVTLIENIYMVHYEDIMMYPVEKQKNILEETITKIESIQMEPTMTINGKEISKLLAPYYVKVLDMLKQLSNPNQIDFNYAETLNSKERLLYFTDMVGKICRMDLQPKLSFEILGEKIEVPVSHLYELNKCKEQIEQLMEEIQYAIDEDKVSNLSDIQQYEYYRRIIQQKMIASKKGPRIEVEYFGYQISIPQKAFESFQECYKRMTLLKDSIDLTAIEEKKKFNVKKVRKPLKDKIKTMSAKTKLKIVSGIASIGFKLSKLSFAAAETFARAGEKIQEKSEDVSITSEKINFCSQFGAVVIPIQNAHVTPAQNTLVSNESENLSKPYPLSESYQKSPCTIVKINIQMPDKSLFSVTYDMDYAQAYVDELLNNGGVIESVGVVPELAEESYKENPQETFNIRLNQLNPAGNNTLLAQEVREKIKENGVIR